MLAEYHVWFIMLKLRPGGADVPKLLLKHPSLSAPDAAVSGDSLESQILKMSEPVPTIVDQ